MSLGSYEVFVAIVERGSLAAAAQQLNLSPSAVSHALATFEQSLGFSLFIRSRTGVKLTAGGEALLPFVREVLQANEKLGQHASQMQGLEAGTVTIGTFSSVSVVWMPRIIRSFRELYPQVKVVIEQGGYDDVSEGILKSRVDIGFVTSPGAVGLDLTPLYSDPMVCIAPDDFTPRNRSYMTVAELADMDVVVQREDSGKDLQQLLSARKVVVRASARAADDATIIAMVECGLGVSVIPDLALQHYQSKVRAYPFFPAESRAIALASLSYDALSPAARAMHDHIVQSVGAWAQGRLSPER
ncbi:LysR family transcriptional regulator [Pseudomonas aeruginosa]